MVLISSGMLRTESKWAIANRTFRLINKAKSVQARLPITIQPTLLLQPWSLPDSEDEKDSDDDLLNDDLPDDLLEQLEYVYATDDWMHNC